MEKCQYGCEKPAKYLLNNGKYCCSKFSNQCSIIKIKNSTGLKNAYKSGKRVVLDYETFKDKLAWRKGKNAFNDFRISSKYKPSEIFCENSVVSKQHVRKIIINNDFIIYKCHGENCNITNEWLNKKIVLDLDHINGINNDHRLENLRFLCPNCHSQTPTFRNKNRIADTKKKNITERQFVNLIKLGLNNNKIIKKLNIGTGNYYKINKIRLKLKAQENLKCIKCDNAVKTKSKTGLCIECSHKKNRKVDRPPIEILKLEVKQFGFSKTGRKYNVSDNAIRKWLLK